MATDVRTQEGPIHEMTELTLLPAPRSITADEGESLTLQPDGLLLIDAPDASKILFTAQRLQGALASHAGVAYEIAAATSESPDGAIALRIDPEHAHSQGYVLTVREHGAEIRAKTPQGLFYGVSTLVQILEQAGSELPRFTVTDWPDHHARGVMLDVSRDKVPTMETVYALVDKLASWKLNEVQLYTEHTFAYHQHKDVWEEASPFTGEEILELDAYCRERFVELVPNQNSFGHMHRWLKHKQYADLAEVEGDFETPWGTMPGPFSLTPQEPGSIQLVASLYDELLPHFTSKQLNVGADETFDLGQGRSREAVAERGVGRVYLDFLTEIYREVTRRGYTMQFWGDIIEQHPELIAELPKDAIALGWGYEAGHDFATLCSRYAAAGVEFYTCPGTSAWCTIAGRTTNALDNLLNAAENGVAHGAKGYLITDWGDRGHWQQLPVSYLGLGAGAAYSWALEANRDLDIAQTISLHAFSDPSGSLGRVAYDLGEVYKALGLMIPNASPLFWVLGFTFEELATTDEKSLAGRLAGGLRTITQEAVQDTLAAIDAAITPLGESTSTAADAEVVRAEFEFTARFLRHAAQRLELFLDDSEDRTELASDLEGLLEEYRSRWLARNRPGGLADSVGRLEALRVDYAG